LKIEEIFCGRLFVVKLETIMIRKVKDLDFILKIFVIWKEEGG